MNTKTGVEAKYTINFFFLLVDNKKEEKTTIINGKEAYSDNNY
jgi:hypothetical protein